MPEEDLGRLMKRLFGDRIAEKAEMLKQVRAGSAMPSLPAADADSTVEVPMLDRGAAAGAAPEVFTTATRVEEKPGGEVPQPASIPDELA
jgi:hypothetical protein